MKQHDLVFIHHAHDVVIYGAIDHIDSDKIVIEVINSSYMLTITKCDPPNDKRGDYNKAIEWFRNIIGLK